MDVSKMFPRKYASGEDLDGKSHLVTIDHIAIETMRPKPNAPEVEQFVLYFKETPKGIILNRTMASQIAQIHGKETDAWIGTQITVYPVPMIVAGQQRTAIRIKG